MHIVQIVLSFALSAIFLALGVLQFGEWQIKKAKNVSDSDYYRTKLSSGAVHTTTFGAIDKMIEEKLLQCGAVSSESDSPENFSGTRAFRPEGRGTGSPHSSEGGIGTRLPNGDILQGGRIYEETTPGTISPKFLKPKKNKNKRL